MPDDPARTTMQLGNRESTFFCNRTGTLSGRFIVSAPWLAAPDRVM